MIDLKSFDPIGIDYVDLDENPEIYFRHYINGIVEQYWDEKLFIRTYTGHDTKVGHRFIQYHRRYDDALHYEGYFINRLVEGEILDYVDDIKK